MKKNILLDPLFLSKLSELIPFETINNYPFDDSNLNKRDAITKKIISYIEQADILFYIEDCYYGIITIEKSPYILQIDSDLSLSIVGETEVDWTFYFLDSYDVFEEFQDFCYSQFSIIKTKPDYNKYRIINEKYFNFYYK